MLQYAFKRIIQALPLLLLISFLVFFLIHIAPFDVVDTLTTPNMTQEQIDLLRQKNGLDQPFLIQYLNWLKQILSGDLGRSLANQTSIGSELAQKIPATLILVLPAYLSSLLLAIVLGLIAAANRGKWLDRAIDFLASVGVSVPSFWYGMILIYILGYQFRLFPIVGMYTVGREGQLSDLLSHFVLPYLTLMIAYFPELLRYVRAAALAQVEEDYVLVQRAFHASEFEIFFKHVLRNVWLPIVTKIGMALPMLITGAIITENIFGWPGVGPYLTKATKSLDYPVIMAVMLLSATLVILGNLLSDILYSVVDPRIRKGAAGNAPS